VLLAASNHFRGPVEDRDEVGVQAGAAAYGTALEEEERGLEAWGWGWSALGEALAEALWAGGWSREMRSLLCIVSPEEVQERIRSRHFAWGSWWGVVKLGWSNVES
jgi:hypothetical protein